MKKCGVFVFVLIIFCSFLAISARGKSEYNVTFINKHWSRLHLQIRVGNESIPEKNALVKDIVLNKGESVSVGYDVVCYYRRDTNPDDPNGNFTTWTSAGCSRNQPCVVDNP